MLLNTVLFAFLATAAAAGPDNMSEFVKAGITLICKVNNVTSDQLQQANIYLARYIDCFPILKRNVKLPVELEAARQNGTVDEVARRFCADADIMKSCSANLTYAAGLCGQINLQTQVPYLINTTNRIIDYFCNEEDNKTILAKFVDEDALHCFDNKSSEFSRCSKLAPSPDRNADLKASFEIVSRCTIDVLKKCSSAAGVRAQNMFDHIRN